MAHEWDSYFHNISSLSSDSSTLRKTSESEGNLPQHIENLIGNHDFSGTVASHETPATNSDTNFYSNPSTGISRSDCVYQQYYKEMTWQADGEQMEKDYLPDFATDGLSTPTSFSSTSFAADLQGLKQDCGMLATSFLEDYSDVSSCSDADVAETRSSCKFMASNLVPKPKADISVKHNSSEWLFTHTDNVTFPTESLCPNSLDTNVIFSSPSDVKAGENTVEHTQCKMESPVNTVKSCAGHNQTSTTSNMMMNTGSVTVKDINDHNCQDQKEKEDVEKDFTRENHSNISIGTHENLTGDGIEKYQDGKEDKQITATVPNIMNTIDNEQDYLDEKLLRKEMEESFNQENKGFDYSNPTDGHDRNMREDEQDKSNGLKEEIKESGSSENEVLDEQKSTNTKSIEGQDENMETDCREKDIPSNVSQSSDEKVSDCKDTSHELRGFTSTLKSNASNKKERGVARNPESCFDPNGSNTDINPCIEKECAAEKTNATSFSGTDCNGPGVTSDSSSIENSDKNNQGIAGHVEACLQPKSSSTDIHSSLEEEMRKEETTTSSTDPDCSGPAVTSDNKQQSVSNSSEQCLKTNISSTDINTCPSENTNTTSSLDQQQSLHQSPMGLESESLIEDVAENARESFEELGIATEEPSVLSMVYGEPLSREDSSCDTDETKLDTRQHKVTSLTTPDGNTMNHSEGQAPSNQQLKSSLQMRKRLQPVVILKTLESVNVTSNSYYCAVCQHTENNVDHLIEHHHCCHSVHNFQHCNTCNIYLLRNEPEEKHLCYGTRESPELPSNPSQHKKKHHGRHKCIRCGLTFSKIIQYIKHMRTHTGKTPFQCKGCALYFAQAGSLQRHKRIPGRCKQSKLPVTNTDAVNNKTTTLPVKDLVLNKPHANLRECYVKLVDISKTNLCRVCGKTFSTEEKAKKHFYNVHKGKSLVVLPSRCTTKPNDENNEKAKNEIKGKYKCPLCPRLFKYSYNRARHLRDCVRDKVYGGKGKIGGKYRCPLCHTTFTMASNRYRHIKTVCLRDCLNRLAKERANTRQNVKQDETKEIEQKTVSKEIEQKTVSKENEQRTQSKENEQKKQAPPAVKAHKNVPRYKCNLCPAVFCHASGKYRHMKKHELFKLTGKMFRYRNSVLSTLCKPANLGNIKEESKGGLKSIEANLSLSCHFCGKCFGTSQSLKKHERNHRGERPYRCLECGKRFKKRAYLIGHKIVHQKRIQCTVCRKILPTIGELIQHTSSHLKKGKLQCPDCHLQFQYPAHLLRHLDSHKNRENKASRLEERPQLKPQQSLETVKEQSGPKQLQCSLCKEVFDDAQVLRKHCLTHISGSSSNQCPFCKHNFTTRRYLLRHMIKHTGAKPFSCNDCGKQFYRDLYLKLHSEKCLPAQTRRLVAMESNIKTKGSHHCSYCPRVFSKKNRLKSHHRGHKTNSLVLCSRCGQYFGFRKLNQHQKNCVGTELNTGLSSPNGNFSKSASQTSDKKALQSKMLQFKCTHCTQRFRYKSLLLRHLVSHTGVQPYACVHCGHRYRTQTMCLQHEVFCNGGYKEGQAKLKSGASKKLSNIPALREAGQKPQAEGEAEYKCKFCTKTFMKSRNLRRHILTHNEVKPYRCKACDSCFSRYDHLKVHQNRCKGKRSRLEVCIPKISLDDVGKGWQNRFGIGPPEKQETFECELCVRSFSTQSKLSRHNTMFHVAKLFKCTRCGASFAHEKSMKKHRKMRKCRKVSKETNASLPLETNPPAENVTTALNGVRSQVMRIQPHFNKKNKYLCSYCPRAFGNSWQLGVHTRLHTGERPYACDFCGQGFIRKDYLQRHFQKCTEKVLCDRCGGFFPKVKLENHKKCCTSAPSLSKSAVCQSQQSISQSPPKGFSCAYCSSRFLLFSQLQEHFLDAHKMETMAPPVSTAPLQHHLSNIPSIKEEPLDESCDERLSDGASLICKLDTALDGEVPKPLSCPECNMSFSNKAGLTGHLRVHTMVHPFYCKTCKRGFWNKSLLRNHNRKCRYGHISRRKTTQELEVPLKAELDFALNDSVLVFKEGSKTTGTGVLQTNFSCKEDFMDESPQNSEANKVQGNSSKEKKAVQYQCSECDQSFTDGLMLISHLEDHGRQEQEKKRNTCSKCGRVCTSPGNLEKHMKIHGVNKKYSCPDCDKTVDTLSDLEIHRTCHDSNRPCACKLCNQRFWTRASLCNHYSEDHPDDVYNCRFCNKIYAAKKSLARHYRKWHQKELKDRESTVQEKSSTEQQSSGLVSTTGESDADENNGTEDSDSDSAPYFPCHVCGKTFPTSESLEDHQRCHLGEKPHECAECGRCFFQASQLQQHQRMHKSEFQCQACGRGFVSLFALRKHKHTHGKSRPHRCPKCDFSFTGPSQLAEHMSTHREENFPCDICNLVFPSKSSRAEHRKRHSKSGHPPSVSWKEQEKSASLSESSSVFNKELKYRCGVCSERFRDPEELSEHGCMAAKERPYSCSDCDKHFLHASHLKKHRNTHQLSWSNNEYPCNHCTNSFSSAQHFLNHLKSHVDTGIKCKTEGKDGGPSHAFKCPVCHQCFASASELIGHFPTHLDRSSGCKICTEHKCLHLTSTTEFECSKCGQSFLGKDAFCQHHCSHQQHTVTENKYSNPSAPPTYHQAVGEEEEVDVTGEDLYNCPVCSMQFSSKSVLLEHQNKHLPNDKPFKCGICGKTFAVKRYLREHERRHRQRYAAQTTAQLTENKLRCTQCQTEFNTAQDLSLHMRLHAEKEVGDYRCDMCYKSFSQWSLLKQHQESHVGQVVYECNECDKAFAFPHLLEEHQQTHVGSSQ